MSDTQTSDDMNEAKLIYPEAYQEQMKREAMEDYFKQRHQKTMLELVVEVYSLRRHNKQLQDTIVSMLPDMNKTAGETLKALTKEVI